MQTRDLDHRMHDLGRRPTCRLGAGPQPRIDTRIRPSLSRQHRKRGEDAPAKTKLGSVDPSATEQGVVPNAGGTPFGDSPLALHGTGTPGSLCSISQSGTLTEHRGSYNAE